MSRASSGSYSSEDDAPERDDFPIVGIGAAAGDVRSYQRLLGAMPHGAGVAFVIAQPSGRKHTRHRLWSLSKSTSMPVLQPSDGAMVEPNRVYLAPPGSYLEIENGRFHYRRPDADGGLRMPIDFFFRSLASIRRRRAIGVILSGTGSDGILGLKEIKAGGGLALLERPTSEVEKNHLWASLAGSTDLVLPVERMGEALLGYLQHPYNTSSASESDADHVDAIVNLLVTSTDYDLRYYKRATLSRRIGRRMSLRGVDTAAEYLRLLSSDPEESRLLYKDLLITVTRFFRDKEAFDGLAQDVLGPLFEKRSSRDSVRIWVPGCATGEEAYSIGILLLEEMARRRKTLDVQIFATDLDEDAIEVARKAVYSGAVSADVSPERLGRFFVQAGEGYRVSKRLRDIVVFAAHDVLRDPPFFHLDLISCRNLMIYLEAPVQKRMVEMFHFALREGGVLFLGKSESTGASADLFQPLSPAWRMYRKVLATHRLARSFPIVPTLRQPSASAKEPSEESEVYFVSEVQRALLERHVPPTVVVDQRLNVHYFNGSVRDYLDFPQGRPSSDLGAMVPEPVRRALRSQIRRVLKTRRNSTTVVRRSRGGKKSDSIRLSCDPVTRERTGDEPLFLVSFAAEPLRSSGRKAKRGTKTRMASDLPQGRSRVHQLQLELEETRDELQSAIQELETSNEELKASNEESVSMNEELRSVNEELETSRDELQSLNEELATVNNELEEKIIALESTTDDLTNFLTSTEIATIFLDTDLLVRRFTPAAGPLLNVIPADTGRRISDLASRVRDPELLTDAHLVLAQLVLAEREVRSEDGRWFIRRILPYRASDGRIQGIVVTYNDVTRLKETGERLARRERQQAVVAALGRRALAGIPLRDLMNESVIRVAETLGNELCKILELVPGKSQFILRGGVGWKEGLVGSAVVPASLESHAGYTLHSRGPVIMEDLSREKRFSNSSLLSDHGVVSGVSVAIGPWEHPWGVLATHSRRRKSFSDDDINFLQTVAYLLWQAIASERTRRALEEREEELQLVADSVPLLIAYVDSGERYLFNNAAYERWFGISRRELRGETMRDLLGEDIYDQIAPRVAEALSGRRVSFELELAPRSDWKGGSEGPRSTLVNFVPRPGADGSVGGFYSVFADVTDLKRAEERVRESEERLRLSQEAGAVGTWDWDVERNVVICSKEFFRIYGLEPRSEISYQTWLGHIHPDDRVELERRLQNAVQGGETIEHEFRILQPEGDERWIAGRARVHQGDDGEVQRVVGVDIDVTSRKRAELQTEKAQEELEKASQLKDEFLAMLGHELRNPLGAISNGIQLLLGGADDDQRQWTEQMLARQTRQLERLVDDLLDVSRITRGLIEIRKEVVELSRCVEQALESVRELVDKNNRELSVVIPDESIHLLADPARMEQILGNLLSNAVKYTEEGGHIELRARRDGGEVTVTVRDDGEGIPEDALELVFQPFVRVGQSLRQAGSGLGIGLTLVKKLAELHGGDAFARSEGRGKGSEFILRLPIYEGSRPDDEMEDSSAAKVDNPLRILIIDDNRDLGEGLQRLLQAMGHEVCVAHDGPEGIEMALRLQPQVALVDIGLPGMDGYEVASKLRSSGKLWIGAVSGFKERGKQEFAGRGLFDHYFIKPLDRDALVHALASLAVSGQIA